MIHPFSRTQLLIGEKAMEKLKNSRVAVFGIGGVGGYVVEALARSGIGSLDLIDSDTVSLTNLNRQLIATQKTIGEYKVDVAEQRILEINPDCRVRTFKVFFTAETASDFDFSQYDYVVDAIDTVSGKIELVLQSERAGVPVISCMGTGNHLDPTCFEVADIYQTSVCPLAKVMRTELRKRGIKKLKVVYTREEPVKPVEGEEKEQTSKRVTPGSMSYAPGVAGLMIAGEVIRDLI